MNASAFLETIPPYKNNAFRSLRKRARFFADIIFCRLFGITRPLWVILVTNNGCDLSCDYCYGCYGQPHKRHDYTTEELIEIIDTLWRMGTRNLTVHGGEALIRNDIGLILNYAKHKGFYVSLNTNGVRIPQMIPQLSCVDCICVSLDGRQEHNDKHRGKGSFAKAIEAMETTVRHNIPLIIHATLTKDNAEDIEYLCELSRKMNARLQFSILYNADKCKHFDFVMSDAETRAVLKKILQFKSAGFPVYYSKKTLRAAIEWPFSYDEKFYATRQEEVVYKNRIRCFHGSLKYYLDRGVR
jgi:sulfatase maturation enzyme AslB (radical SAM superfamily)